MKLGKSVLKTFEFLFILVIVKRRCQINFAELRHFFKREFLFKGVACISAVLNPTVDPVGKKLECVSYCSLTSISVKNMPGDHTACFLHIIVIGFFVSLIFLLLRQVVTVYTPLGLGSLDKRMKTLKLLVLFDMKENLDDQIPSVP